MAGIGSHLKGWRAAGAALPPGPQQTCSGRALALHKEGVYCVLPQKLYKKGSNVNSKRKTSPNSHSSPVCSERSAKGKSEEEARTRSLPRLKYKKWGLCPLSHPMRSMRIAELNRELEAGLRLGPVDRGPEPGCQSAYSPRCSGLSDWCGNVPEML